jgi:hypothetical protein
VGAEHDVVDDRGEPIGRFGKEFGASLLRSTWTLAGPGLEVRGAGHGQQADRAAPEDEQALAGRHLRPPDRPPGDRSGLDEERIADVEAVRQVQQHVFGNDDSLGHAAVDEDAQVAVARFCAPRRVATEALGAASAVDRRLYEHSPPVVGVAANSWPYTKPE